MNQSNSNEEELELQEHNFSGRPKRNSSSRHHHSWTPKKSRTTQKDTHSQEKKKQDEKAENVLNVLCVMSQLNSGHQLSPKAKANLFRLAKLEEDVVEKLEYQLPLGTHMPDHHNYRLLEHSFFDPIVIPKPVKNVQKIGQNKSKSALENLTKLRLAGDLFLNPMTSSGAEILEKALEAETSWVNTVFSNSHSTQLPDLDHGLVDLEQKFLEQEINYFPGSPNMAPTRLIVAKDLQELESPEFREAVLSTSIVLIRNVDKIVDFQKDLYSVKSLLEPEGDAIIQCMAQVPQQSTTNVDPSDGKEVWKATRQMTEMAIRDFVKYQEQLKEVAKEAFDVMKNHKATKEEYDEVKRKVCQVKVPKTQFSLPRVYFGTNFDLTDAKKHHKQLEELNKLPAFLRPKGPDDLLQYMDEDLPGINVPQVYFKNPSSRTFGHLENAALSSLNINLGPAPCVWYAVPFEFAERMRKMLQSKNQNIYGGFWPSEDAMRNPEKKYKWGGMPLQKFVQEPGDIVYVGTGTFHWVTCPGFAINVAWNIAQPIKTQICSMMVMHDHSVECNAYFIVPVMKIFWNLAKKKKFVNDKKLYPVIKNLLARYLAYSQFELIVLKNYISDTSGDLMSPMALSCGSVDGSWAKAVERCQKCTYPLKNTIVRIEKTSESYCVGCYLTLKSKCHVYIRNDISEIVKVFNAYVPQSSKS